MTRPALALLVLLLAACAVLPATAGAAGRSKIIKDCATDGVLQGDYTPAELRDARQNLPSDVAEYTDCLDVLRRAELADRSAGAGVGGAGAGAGGFGGGGSGGSGGGTGPAFVPVPAVTAQPQDRATLDAARKAAEKPVTLGSTKLVPTAGVRIDTDGRGLPASLIVTLGILALCACALAVPGVRRLPQRLRSLRR